MFLYVKQIKTVRQSSVKNNKYCKERTEDKVGECVYLLKLSNNYYRLIVNVRYKSDCYTIRLL